MIQRRKRTLPLIASSLSLVLLLAAPAQTIPVQPELQPAVAGYDWLQFNGDPQHSGNNRMETIITPSNVATLALAFQTTLPSYADGAPAYLRNVATATGPQNLLFVTTRLGHITAINARTGAIVWSKQHGPGNCHINGGATVCYTTSSPAIDPNHQFLYSYGLDGFVHKHRVGDGQEITTGGWPELVTRKPYTEKGSSALATSTAASGVSYLYVANGGYPGDQGNYQGHITTINLSTGTQHVFNATCSNQIDVHFVEAPANPSCSAVQTAVWARPGVVYDAQNDRVFLATGNGIFDPATHKWGDSVLAIRSDGTGSNGNPVDTYTPTNHVELDQQDIDLGSTAPAILPTQANSSVRNLGVQTGKDGKLRLLNLDNLSSQGGIGHTGGEVGPIIDVPQGGRVLTTPAVWVNPADQTTWTFVANGNGIAGLQLVIGAGGVPHLQPRWQQLSAGTSPVVANGVVFQARGNTVEARNALTGARLWQATIGPGHWNSPVVANGVVYITDGNNHLTAFAPNGQIPVLTPLTSRLYLPQVER